LDKSNYRCNNLHLNPITSTTENSKDASNICFKKESLELSFVPVKRQKIPEKVWEILKDRYRLLLTMKASPQFEDCLQDATQKIIREAESIRSYIAAIILSLLPEPALPLAPPKMSLDDYDIIRAGKDIIELPVFHSRRMKIFDEEGQIDDLFADIETMICESLNDTRTGFSYMDCDTKEEWGPSLTVSQFAKIDQSKEDNNESKYGLIDSSHLKFPTEHSELVSDEINAQLNAALVESTALVFIKDKNPEEFRIQLSDWIE